MRSRTPAKNRRLCLAWISAARRALAVWGFGNRFSLRPGGTRDSSPRFIAGLAVQRICVPEGRLKLELGCYESAVRDRFKVEIATRRATSPAQQEPSQRNEQRRAQNPPPNYPLLSLRPPVQIFLNYFCHPRSKFRRPFGTQTSWGLGTRR
jgi:hypothetical protein